MKIIIADDEYWIRRDIIKLIESLYPERQHYIAGEAVNGSDLIQKIEKLKPDLVIADVQMPVMNGLSAISRVRNRFPDISWIILTGYAEFEYAHTAIKLGVKEYLLKPIEQKDLMQAINRIESERKELHQDFKSSISSYFNDRLLGINTDRKRGQLSGYIFQAALVTCEINERDAALQWLQDMAEQKNDREDLSEISYILVPEGYIVLYYQNNNGKPQINRFTDRLKKDLEGLTKKGVHIVALASDADESIDKVVEQIKISREYHRFHITSRNGKVNQFHECDNYIRLLSPSAVDYVENLNLLVTAYHRRSLIYFLERCATAINGWQTYKTSFNEELEENLRVYYHHAFRLDRCLPSEEWKNLTFGDLLLYISDHAKTILYTNDKAADSPVESAVQIILNSYDQDISIAFVAKKIGVSPNYLSALFHKETGISFVKYLTNVRMNKAKELLADSMQSVSSVALKTGYKNANYFAKVFKEYFDISPSDFQSLIRKEL